MLEKIGRSHLSNDIYETPPETGWFGQYLHDWFMRCQVKPWSRSWYVTKATGLIFIFVWMILKPHGLWWTARTWKFRRRNWKPRCLSYHCRAERAGFEHQEIVLQTRRKPPQRTGTRCHFISGAASGCQWAPGNHGPIRHQCSEEGNARSQKNTWQKSKMEEECSDLQKIRGSAGADLRKIWTVFDGLEKSSIWITQQQRWPSSRQKRSFRDTGGTMTE